MTIAPHINNEIRLILAGAKPLATIEKGKDPVGYGIAVSLIHAGVVYGVVSPSDDCSEGEVTFTRVGGKPLIDKYFYLLKDGVKDLGIKQYHREMGKLFGYSEQDIEDFIESEVDCNCSKCKGN